jgi:hypothetical protein
MRFFSALMPRERQFFQLFNQVLCRIAGQWK